MMNAHQKIRSVSCIQVYNLISLTHNGFAVALQVLLFCHGKVFLTSVFQ